jgi:hypothetical protein
LNTSWTRERSRLATATRRIRIEGPTPEAERNLLRARRDYIASRLEYRIRQAVDAKAGLSAAQRDGLVALLDQAVEAEGHDGPGDQL